MPRPTQACFHTKYGRSEGLFIFVTSSFATASASKHNNMIWKESRGGGGERGGGEVGGGELGHWKLHFSINLFLLSPLSFFFLSFSYTSVLYIPTQHITFQISRLSYCRYHKVLIHFIFDHAPAQTVNLISCIDFQAYIVKSTSYRREAPAGMTTEDNDNDGDNIRQRLSGL